MTDDRRINMVVVSNEPTVGADPDIPWAVERLRRRGILERVGVFSARSIVAERGTSAAADELASVCGVVNPDVVLWLNSKACRFGSRELDRIEAAAPKAAWAYREGDPFTNWVKPYPRSALPTLARCSSAFMFVGGSVAEVVRRAGCRFVTYAPSWVNTDRYPAVWSSDSEKLYDAVFVGNRLRSWRGRFAGTRQREELVDALTQQFGSRFAVFGDGWTGPSSKGVISFAQICGVYAQAATCVGFDHQVGPYQFSNRLPIAFSCGVPVVQARFVGAGEIVPLIDDHQFFDDPAGVVEAVQRIIGMTPRALDGVSWAERRTAESMSVDTVLEYILRVASCPVRGQDPAELPNPWLAHAHDRL